MLQRAVTDTILVPIYEFAKAHCRQRGQGKPETFDFLGMTHCCEQTRKGKFRVGRTPSRKRVHRTLRRIKEALRRRCHDHRKKTAKWLGQVITGWLNDYAVPGSCQFLRGFIHPCKRLLMRALRRRSQRDRTEWGDIITPDRSPLAHSQHPPPVA